MSFVQSNVRTLSMMDMPVWVAKPAGTTDKRFCTLQMCIRACGEQVVRLAIIFRGQGRGVYQQELELYASLSHLIQVYFQVCL
jgi:hypothetical protein